MEEPVGCVVKRTEVGKLVLRIIFKRIWSTNKPVQTFKGLSHCLLPFASIRNIRKCCVLPCQEIATGLII